MAATRLQAALAIALENRPMTTTTFRIGLVMALVTFVVALTAFDVPPQSRTGSAIVAAGFALGAGLCFIAAAIANAKSD